MTGPTPPERLELIQGDITTLSVAAIVNPANSHLQLGGGVAGAIRLKGGPEIQAQCDAIGYTPVGSAAITGGGNLPAEYVIHAVGPRWGEGGEEAKLASAVTAALELARDRGLTSLALPAISTGIFGFPVESAAVIILRSIIRHLGENRLPERVTVCLFSEDALVAFKKALARAADGYCVQATPGG